MVSYADYSPKLKGNEVPSIATSLLEGLPEGNTRAEKEEIAKNCMGVAIVGMFFSTDF